MRPVKPIGFKTKLVGSIIAAVSILVLLVMLMFNSGIDALVDVASVFVVPVEKAAVSFGDSVSSFFRGFSSVEELETENDELKLELAKLQSQLQQYNEIKTENDLLRGIIGESEKYPEYQLTAARVLISKTDAYTDTYTLDKGTDDGIQKDMAVIAPGGLAGRIIEAGTNYSIMLSIIDSRSSVSCVVERTRDLGVVKGYSISGTVQSNCNMTYMPMDSKSLPSDVVKTSGRDDVFPKGITVGSIVEISAGEKTLGANAVVQPVVDFDHLELVLVITGTVE